MPRRGTATVLIGLACVVVGIGIGFLGAGVLESGNQRVRLMRDIDLVKDHAFNNGLQPFEPTIQGQVKKDSIGIVDMRKGSVVYLHFPIVLSLKDVEDVEER